MPNRDPMTVPSDGGLIARHAARLDACWPHVRVESTSVTRGASGECATAVVQLGGLVPADVRVELVSVHDARSASPPPVERRMACSHALDNGSFVFEVTLPPHDGVAREWVIHVHPAEALDEPRVERHFWTGTGAGTVPATATADSGMQRQPPPPP